MTSSPVVVVGVLDKVDGVGTTGGVLVHLEVVGGESERPQDHVTQILQLTCRSEVTQTSQMHRNTDGFYSERTVGLLF